MNLKNKHWFSFSLFREGLRQLRLITALFSLLAAAYGILSIVNIWVNYSTYANPESFIPILRTMPEAQPLLLISFCVVTPILTLYMFRFLNSRRDCDFYHALPDNRICLFNSFFAAILVSVMIYMAVCILSVGISSLVFSAWVTLDWSSVFQYAIHLFAASFYVAAFVSIAMAVTGTLISNLIVSGLLIFGPRLILIAVSSVVLSHLPLIPDNYQRALLSNNYNIVNGMVFGILGNNYSYSIVLTSAAAFWYTMAMGLVLTVIAAILFYRRKSEAAGQSAPNRILGAIYRLSIAYMISLVPLSVIFDYKIEHISLDREDFFNLFILYLIVAAVFYLYELLMTKKLKRLWKVTPSLLLIPVLNVLTLIIMSTCYSQALSFTPDASEITGIQFLTSRSYNWSYGAYCYDYYKKETENLPLTDEVICDIIARNLAAETEALQNDSYSDYVRTNSNAVNVAVVTKGKTAYRTVYMNSMDMAVLTNQLSYNPELEELYSALPDRNEASFQMRLGDEAIVRNSDEEKAIYQALLQDIEEMGFENWYSYVNEYTDTSYTLTLLQLSVSRNDSLLVLGVPLAPELPHTFAAYLNTLDGQPEALQELSYILDSSLDGSLAYLYLYCQVYLPDGTWYDLNTSIWNNEYSDSGYETEIDGLPGLDLESVQSILTALQTESVTPLSADQILIHLNCDWFAGTDEYAGDYSIRSVWLGFNQLPEAIQEWITWITYQPGIQEVY